MKEKLDELLAFCFLCEKAGRKRDMVDYKNEFFHHECLGEHLAMLDYELEMEAEMVDFFYDNPTFRKMLERRPKPTSVAIARR